MGIGANKESYRRTGYYEPWLGKPTECSQRLLLKLVQCTYTPNVILIKEVFDATFSSDLNLQVR